MTITSNRKNNGPRAVTYLRVASQDQDDQRLSVAAQRVACQCEAERRGVVVTDEFADVGASGNSRERAGLQQLLTTITERSVECVIVRDRARLARNLADDVAINAALRQAGVTLVTANQRNGGRL